jgi:uncharacterized zinc-type alcohol dehydrogenase-like protein
MISAKGYAAQSSDSPLQLFHFDRRDTGLNDVRIEILYCGICHSDLHTARNEWRGTIYPCVPGHEIVGRVTETGSKVTKHKTGDIVGVGCMVDSCRTCDNCKKGLEQYCRVGSIATYNSQVNDPGGTTFGGYSNNIIVREDFVLKITHKQLLESVAPLLCAGITTYSPMRHWGISPGHKVAVVGLGGLGHMAVKLAASFGAEVTMLSTSPEKEKDARHLGAHNFELTTDSSNIKKLSAQFNFIVDTVSAEHDMNQYLGMLDTDGVMICVGAPPKPSPIASFRLIGQRRSLVGSLIGGIAETQEMLDYCAGKNIVSDVEVVPITYINEAYERMLKGDVKYRFVIDMQTLK